jgi:hypothetical protein
MVQDSFGDGLCNYLAISKPPVNGLPALALLSGGSFEDDSREHALDESGLRGHG